MHVDPDHTGTPVAADMHALVDEDQTLRATNEQHLECPSGRYTSHAWNMFMAIVVDVRQIQLAMRVSAASV